MLNELIQTGQKEIQVIIFSIGNEDYATEIANIQEIIIPVNYTRIPKSPPYVKGVINLRGNVIPVIDGQKKFHLEKSEKFNKKQERIMIMETEDGTMGLVVDNVSDVIRLNIEDIEPSPVDLGENNEIFWGVGRYMDKLFILINCQKGLSIRDVPQ